MNFFNILGIFASLRWRSKARDFYQKTAIAAVTVGSGRGMASHEREKSASLGPRGVGGRAVAPRGGVGGGGWGRVGEGGGGELLARLWRSPSALPERIEVGLAAFCRVAARWPSRRPASDVKETMEIQRGHHDSGQGECSRVTSLFCRETYPPRRAVHSGHCDDRNINLLSDS